MQPIFLAILLLFNSFGFAASSEKLIIHATEYGVGKFHRYDNQVHPYPKNSAWLPYILPGAASTDNAAIQKNPDGSFTVFFSTLDQLIESIIKISQEKQQKVAVLNLHGHGLPGAMWFPKDAEALAGWECSQWQDSATGDDQDNYDQYYSPVSVSEIMDIRQMSNSGSAQMGCTTGLPEWQNALEKNPQFKKVFAVDARIHFLSCVVGLGTLGEAFTKGIAELLLPKGSGRVESSMDFGLGDWSMPSGMGFWDYQSDDQVNHDGDIYPTDRKDSEIAQKGTIRIASYSGTGWRMSLLGDQKVLPLDFDSNLIGTFVPEIFPMVFQGPLPKTIRVPGTRAYVNVRGGQDR